MSDPTAQSFTGRRRRQTSRGVKIADRAARTLISIGGIGTIIAVGTVCIFLIYVAVPLFRSPHMADAREHAVPWTAAVDRPIHVVVDEYRVLGATVFADGSAQVFRLDNGEPLGGRFRLFEDRIPTAWQFSSDTDAISFGFDNGQAQLGTLGIRVQFLSAADVDEAHGAMPLGQVVEYGDGLLVHARPGQYRLHWFYSEFEPPLDLATSPIRLIGHTQRSSGPMLAVFSADGKLAINAVTQIRNFLSGEATSDVRRAELPYESPAGSGEPSHLLLSGLGDTAYLAWRTGTLHRYDLRDLNNPTLAESVKLTDSEAGVELTAMGFMIGRTTLIAGDSSGRLTAWFRIKPREATTSDGTYLAATHDLGAAGAAVTSITTSARSRIMAAGFADGSVRLYHVTTNQQLAAVTTQADEPIAALAMGSRDDLLFAATDRGMWSWHIDRKHPDVNLAGISRPVWYEGHHQPRHMWQSSSGTDDFEPKYGLWPLVFGTLKATFYSMLFGLPIALAAAVFTSEFLHPRVKARIKPTIEMMASLPSVVLGFLAAVVIAPVVEQIVPGLLACFVSVPVCLLIGAYLWQLMPQALTLRLLTMRGPMAAVGGARFLCILLLVILGAALGLALGPAAETTLFAGDIKLWLDGQIGNAAGGWLMLFLPISALLVALAMSLLVSPWLRGKGAGWSRQMLAGGDLAKFAFGAAATLLLALGVAALLTGLGFDPRGSDLHHTMGTYVQRNALIVGFIMGFAIIPIIYTIAEDALSAVPEHLRSASLGAGATVWQTAVRIIIPTAMSGLFSATMIGLGRAVGETMIVLVAAGNTPVMQMNIFNGFRTLSANIAVELPEAPVNGTHYRMLFLAALTLFAMTFVVNTAAEVVRQRFRRRAFQL